MSHEYPVARVFNAPRHLCIHHLLEEHAEHTPDAPVIIAPGRDPLEHMPV